jgi:hypothetical protein
VTVVHRGLARHLGDVVDELTYAEDEGGNIFIDDLPESPDTAVAVLASTGIAYEPDSKLPYDPFYVQIVVRSTSNPDWALDVWEGVYSALHGLRNFTLPDGTYVVFAIASGGSPIRLGPDAAGRYRYSMNLRGETLRG